MKNRSTIALAGLAVLSLLAAALPSPIIAADEAARPAVGIGIRGGVGTDINGGLAYGGSINYVIDFAIGGIEVGPVFYGGSFEETSNNGYNDYTETTDIVVYAVMANFLLNYHRNTAAPFFVAGMGFGGVSVSWKEESPTDTSLGTLLPGGGSKQEEDGSAGGTVFNVGGGYNFGNGFDLRVELPVFIMFSVPGEAAAVVPTGAVSAGIRF